MKIQMFLAALLLITFAGHASAETEDDAMYIVKQTVNEETFRAAISSLGPVISGAIENDLRAKGIVVSDVDAFSKIVFEEFLGGFTEEMQKATTAKYLQVFSADELSGIATFFRSNAGQAYLGATPELMAFGSQEGQRIGAIAGQQVGARVAERLKSEGIQVTQPGMTDKLIEALK